MANTRFKTENGLLVTGGNAQFDEIVSMSANLYVDADLVLISGDLQVAGAQVFTGGQVYTADITADVDGLKLGNTTNQFDAFLGTTRIYDALIPVGNTVPLGNATNRWVITANNLNLSGNAAVTGNVAVTGTVAISNTLSATGAVTFGNTLSVTNAVTFSNTLAVTGSITTSANLNVTGTINAAANLIVGTYATGTVNGVNITNNAFIIGNTSANAILTGSSLSINSSAATLNVGTSFSVNSITLTAGSVNASFDSGVLFVDSTTNRVGINNTAPGVALRVTGAADISLTANIQGNANVGGTLGVSGATNVATLGVSGNLMVTDSSRVHYIAGNSVFGGGALTINSVEGRVGIGTSTPDVTFTVSGSSNVSGAARFGSLVTIAGTMSVTGAANVLNTLGISGAANALGTFGITGSANALGTLGVNGLLTAAGGLNATGTINASANLNVGTYASGTVNGVNITNNALIIGNTTANAILTGSSLSINSATASLNIGTYLTANSTVLATGATTNVNMDSGVLFVDATNSRVGINNTAPGVALRVTGDADISLTANIQGNANVGGTLGVAGLVSLSNNNGNTFQVGSAPWSLGVVNTHVGMSRTIDSSFGANELTVQIKSANATVTAGRNHFGIRQATMVEHEHKNSGGTYLGTSYYGIAANVYNGNSSIGGDSRVTSLFGIAADVANYANGSSSNTVGSGLGGSFSYEVRGSGVTTNAWGARGYIDVANNSVTGNITAAYGIDSRITSNTAMTIATGYLYYGAHSGTTTTNKYGLFLTGEGNNYFSGDVHVAGTVNAASYRIGTSTLVVNSIGITHTGYVNAASIIGGTTNSSFDSGVLFVDALNNRVGINDTAPGVALRVTGAVDISLTANIQGNANVGGTLGVASSINATSFTAGALGVANSFSANTSRVFIGNTTANALLSTALNVISIANSSGITNVNPTFIVTPTVNATSNLNIGTLGTTNGVNANTTVISVGNNSINVQLGSTTTIYANSTVNVAINSTAIFIGNSSVTTTITSNSNARGRRSIVSTVTTTNPAVANPSPQNGDIVYFYDP